MFKSWNAIPVGAMLAACLLGGAASAADCEVKIGATGPMTGSAAAWGIALKAATDFEAKMVNDAGGLQMGNQKCKVTVLSIDAQYTASGGAAASNYFASQGIHVVMGPIGSPEATGFKTVAARNNQVNYTSAYYAQALGPDFPLTFHFEQNSVAWGPKLVEAGKKVFGFKTAIILGPNDQGGTDPATALHKLYGEQGVNATEEYYQRGTTNFGPMATRIMAANPDLVEFAGTPPGDLKPIVRQLLEAGYKGVFAGLAGGGSVETLIEAAGGVQNVKGYFWLEEVPVDSADSERLRQDFKKVMNDEPSVRGIFYTSVVGVEQLLRGIQIAGTDQDGAKVAEAMRHMTPESKYYGKGGWRGKAQFGINQELAFPVGMGLIKDGKREKSVSVPLPSEN